MAKNLIWKSLLIVVVVGLISVNMFPLAEKLKGGQDLVGGTSLVYEIDTTGLNATDRKGLAQNMIPILLKRIDPTHVANIVMRPQGDSRIEIQLPLASRDTRNKREKYEEALLKLDAENINLLKIRQSLTLEADERTAAFETFAGDSNERREILTALAQVHDQRKQMQAQRDVLAGEMDSVKTAMEAAGLEYDSLEYNITTWAEQENDKRKESIETYIKSTVSDDVAVEGKLGQKQLKEIGLLNEYIELYNKWVPVVNDLTKPEEGLNAKWNAAESWHQYPDAPCRSSAATASGSNRASPLSASSASIA